jgi:hypothetical protein
MNKFKYIAKNNLRNLHWRLKHKLFSTIISRHACLGYDVLKLLNIKKNEINIQKGRVDYLIDCWQDSEKKAKSYFIGQYLNRPDIFECILQEEILYDWANIKTPKVLFMDSMAELADQRFKFKKGKWSFLSSFMDINHTDEFKKYFDNEGLLELELLENHFLFFFKEIRKKYGLIPIFYLHFPHKLEHRTKFITRALSIKSIIDKISESDKFLFSISADEQIVDWDENRSEEMRNFPYHYNKETYLNFAEKIISTGKFKI